MSACRPARGFTLLEMIFLIIVLAIAGSAATIAIDRAVQSSADPMRQKQALAVAEAFVEEVLTFSFATASWAGASTQANRASFDDMRDYNGFTATGVSTRGGTAIDALAAYGVSVGVQASPAELPAALPAVIPAADTMRVRVQITDGGRTYTVDTYAFNY